MADQNPCTISGAGNTERRVKIIPATLDELETIATDMPDRLQLMVLLAAWCAMRFGELAELRRKDIDNKNVIRVRRGVVRAGGEMRGHDTEVSGREPRRQLSRRTCCR